MSGMQIYSQKIAQTSGSGQLSLKSTLNPGGYESVNNTTFDSLIKNIQTKPKNSRTDHLFNAAESRERHKVARHDEVKRDPAHAKKHDEVNNREYHDTSDRIREHASRHDDMKVKKNSASVDDAHRGHGRSDNYKDDTAAVQSQEPLKTDDAADESQEMERETRTAALLLDILNGQSGTSSADAPDSGPDVPVEAGNGQDVGAGKSGEDLKADAFIALTLIQAGDTPENVQSENVLSSAGESQKNSIKSDQLLSEELKGDLSKFADLPEGEEGDITNEESLTSDSKSLESGLKTDASIFHSKGKSADDQKIPFDMNGVEAQAQTENPDADEAGLSSKEPSGRSGKHPDPKHDHLEELKALQNTTGADSRETYKGANEMSQKVSSEFAGSLNRESGVKQYTGDIVRPAHTNTESNTAGSMHSSVVTREAGKAPEMFQPGAMTKPSAFSEISDKITYMVKGQHRLGVTVENETLGKLNISLSLEKGMVNVHIHTADRVVREFVENNIHQIVASLSKNGVSVGGFSVGLNNYKNPESNWNRNGSNSPHDRGFSIHGIEKKQYMHAGTYTGVGSGGVNIFA